MGLISVLQDNFQIGIFLIITLIFSLSFHEFAHAYIAYKLGDNTAAHRGRLTLNPIAHLDPIGSLMMLFIGFGYARPVPVNPINFDNPRTGMMKVAFAGPASNLFLAIFTSVIFRILFFIIKINNPIIATFLALFVFYNLLLALFNLIPLFPLDGGQIFGGFLDKINPGLSNKLRLYSPQILLFIIFMGFLSDWIDVSQLDIIGNYLFLPCTFLANMMLGVPFF